jgi:hypothetical protein
MCVSPPLVIIATLCCGLTLTALMLGSAEAYVDPGTTGMLSQLLYILFYGVLAVFLYCLRYIKQALVRGKQYLSKTFRAKKLTRSISMV